MIFNILHNMQLQIIATDIPLGPKPVSLLTKLGYYITLPVNYRLHKNQNAMTIKIG